MSVVDSVTLTVDADTTLVPDEPMVLVTGEELCRLRLGDEVLIWIHRKEAVRLIGAIVAASQMQIPDPKANGFAPQPEPPGKLARDLDEIPF